MRSDLRALMRASALVCLLTGSALGHTETFSASKDAFVWNEVPDINIGAQSVSEVGREEAKEAAVGLKRGLLHFDISVLPAQAIITEATLKLFIAWKYLPSEDPTDLSITVSRLAADFVEGDGTSGVTWNTQPGVEASPTSTAVMDASAGDWFEMDVTAVVVAEWQSAQPTDVLIRISPTAETSARDKYFGYRTKEFETGTSRARLLVEYAIPTATPIDTPTPTLVPTPTATATGTEGPAPTATPEDVTMQNDLTAPPLDLSVATSVHMAAEFLYNGENPVQTDVVPGAIDARRAAILRGRVVDPGGQPVAGVHISIVDAPELGGTLTRANGMFDMAVNGGGALIVQYQKAGLITVHRQADVSWQEYIWLPEIVMISYDATVAEVDLTQGDPFQVADGGVVTDNDGTRQPRLLFKQGTTATMVFADGTQQPVAQPMHVRATEFTVGENGPRAMPAQLPPASAYTYAVELDVVEAAGAVRVEFDQPVIFYLENFLPSDAQEAGLPVGLPVPSGYYDRVQGLWVPSEDGRIVRIVSFDQDDRADLDTDGDGLADNDPELGITDAERAELDPARYAVGHSLWRVPVTHFTPWDFNFPFVPDDDAIEPTEEPEVPQPESCVDTQVGSTIGCQNQTLGESVPVTGTPFRLHYGSDRVPGRRSAYTMRIPLTGEFVPPSLKRVELTVMVAGRLYEMAVESPDAELSTSFTWDGVDAYGRTLQGTQSALIRIGYVYNGVYAEPDQLGRSFARFSGVPLSFNPARQEITLARSWRRPIGTWDARAVGLGGWTLNVHHANEPTSGVVWFGSGTQLSSVPRDQVIHTVAGTGEPGEPGGDNGDNGRAELAKLTLPAEIAVAPDGAYYIADTLNCVVRRISPDGIISTVAGNGDCDSPTPGMPATSQPLKAPTGLAVHRDGSVYFSDQLTRQVYRIAPDGILELIAGAGGIAWPPFSGDGTVATSATLDRPIGVAVGADGSVYVSDWGYARVFRVAPDGIIATAAGNEGLMASGDGGPATAAAIGRPMGIGVGRDGSLYVTDIANHVVRRVGPDGIISSVAGIAGQDGFISGGMPATDTLLLNPLGVAVDRDGALFIADAGNGVVRRVAPSGIATIVAGQGEVSGFGGDGGPAAAALLWGPAAMAITPDGALLITDRINNRIRKVHAPGKDRDTIPSGNGMEVYVFDDQGRHVETRHGLTGAILFSFAYDPMSRVLDRVTDGDGNVTEIQYDGNGAPVAIIAPFGQQTLLTLNGDGFLDFIRNPASEQIDLIYSSSKPGLLEQMIDARNNAYVFTHDEDGYLERDDDPAGGYKSLERNELPNGYAVTLTTKLGRATTYEVVNALSGDQLRTNTDPANLAAGTTIGSDGRTVRTTPDGMQFTTTRTGDPRFGMLAPVRGSYTAETPQGRVLTVTTSRVATPPDDPLQLDQLLETVVINGHQFTTQFDAGSPSTVTTTTDEFRETVSTIDSQGRATSIQAIGTDPVLHPVRREYDSQGRVSSIKHGPDPDTAETRVTSFVYKSNAGTQTGLLDTVTDATGRAIQFDYDDAGRVITQTFAPGVPGFERIISYDYDDNGNLRSVTPPGRPMHLFHYTPVNLEKEYVPPQVGLVDPKTTYLYNDDRQLEEISRPDGVVIDFAYEPAAGRLESVTIPAVTGSGTEVRTYTYHPTTGALHTLTGPDATLTFGYDGALLTSEEWSDGSVTTTVNHAYYDDFRLETLRVNSADAIDFVYDGDGLLTKAGGLDPIVRHGDYGFVTSTTLAAVADAITYTPFGELETYTASTSGGPVYEYAVTERDALGRIVTKVETIGGVTTTTEYAYDPAGRLSDVFENAQHVAHYEYDANGNRIDGFNVVSGQIISSGVVYDDQDRLMSYETLKGGSSRSVTFEYNENGFLTRTADGADVTTYRYDALGNLRRVVRHENTANEQVIEYLVDGRNRRIGTAENGVIVRRFVYQDQLNPVAELDGAGNLVSQFVYATKPNVPDYMIHHDDPAPGQTTTYRIISDHLGSVRLVLDASDGSIAQRIDYDEFGCVLTDTNPGFQPFGFAGGLHDAHTGLVRFGARDYDPEVGRWAAKDPIRFGGGDSNLYGYVLGDPVNGIDPSGKGLVLGLICEAVSAGITIKGFYDLAQASEQVLELRKQRDALESSCPIERRAQKEQDQIDALNRELLDAVSREASAQFQADLGIGGAIACALAFHPAIIL